MTIRPVLVAIYGRLLGYVSAPENSQPCAKYSVTIMGREGEVISGVLMVASGRSDGPGEIKLLVDASTSGKLSSLLRRKLASGQSAITIHRKECVWFVNLLPETVDDEVFLDGRSDGDGVTGSVNHATEAGIERIGWFVAVCRR
jgi:hypothetical protein